MSYATSPPNASSRTAPPSERADTAFSPVSERSLFAFFVVSGFCALLCQVVWLRLAMASFGVTTAMVSIVVSVFMAGLAGGSAAAGRLVSRLRPAAALRFYAGCELVVAASAQVVPAALERGRALISGSSWGSGAYHLASGAWVALVLLPFCAAMGATLPLALAAVGPRLRAGGSAFGHLYAANVLGAAVGTLLSALVLIEVLGLRGTVQLGAFLNALLAAAALTLSLRARGLADAGSPAPAAFEPRGLSLLLPLFGTGFASMAMEVVWVRQFAPLLGNVVYAFAIILAAYLVATLGGSLVYRARSSRQKAEGPGAGLWILVALAALLPVVASDPRLPGGVRFVDRTLPAVSSVLLVAVSVAPFCALLGFVTPWLVDRWARGDPRRTSLAYAVNAVGCIAGPLAGGFVLLPALGERWALYALALVLLAIGVRQTAPAHRRRAIVAAAAGAALVALARGEEARFEHVRVRRDSTATVLLAGQGLDRALLVNGISMTSLTPITKFMTHLPLAFLERAPRRGLVVCLGMGTSFRSMHAWGVETTAVELVPSVPSFFPDLHADGAAVLSSPLARVVVDDGRRFLDRTSDLYDAIVVDPPPPVEAAGSSLLYSREFYRAVRPRLAPDGILQTWLPGAEPVVAASFLLALREAFPYVRVFGSVEGWGVHFLASARPIPPRDAATLAARLPAAAAADLVEWGPHATVREQLAAVVAREIQPDWHGLARLAGPLTDDRPLNEYFLVRRLRSGGPLDRGQTGRNP